MQAFGAEFGKQQLYMDGTFSTNRYNYVLRTLGDKDVLGRFVPAGFCISSSEGAEPLQQLLEAFRLRVLGGHKPTVMVDKGSSETAALRGLGWPYVLCLFHYMQVRRCCLAAWLPGCLARWLAGSLARGLAAWLPGCLAVGVGASLLLAAAAAQVKSMCRCS